MRSIILSLLFALVSLPAHAQFAPVRNAPQSYRNGASLDMDFVGGNYMVSVTSPVTYTSLTAFLADANVSGTFSRSSIGTYVDSTGTLQTAQANTPRFDYDPVTHAAKGLLIEETRTNLIISSSDLTGAAWGRGNSTVSSDIIAGPDGTITADKSVANTTNNGHNIGQTVTISANVSYTYSLFLKAAEYTKVIIYGGKSGTPFTRGGMTVDLTNGTYSNADINAPLTVTNRTVQALPNGWYRVMMTVLIDVSSTDGYLEVRPVSGGTAVFAGDGNSGFYVWGGQIESGAFPTSVIPTSSTAVTRQADKLIMPTGNWYAQGVGTLLSNVVIPYEIGSSTTDPTSRLAGFDDGTSANGLSLGVSHLNSAEGQASTIIGSSFIYNKLSAASFSNNALIKGAMAYDGSTAASAFNGVALGSASAASPGSLTTFRIGGVAISGVYYLNGWATRAVYFPTSAPAAALLDYTR